MITTKSKNMYRVYCGLTNGVLAMFEINELVSKKNYVS
jgi:hypothetical protein